MSEVLVSSKDDIDFVVLWVDGGDPEWKKLRAQYAGNIDEVVSDDRDMRYRDWDNMQYWFRSVEKYAPWVRKVYFITNGQKPVWLNEKAEKLVWVKHEDYMDKEYLPTFNSHAIENNILNIEGLSENFVYFNDDMFLTDYCDPTMFFYKGKPVLPAYLRPIIPVKDSTVLLKHVHINMMYMINKNFSMKESIRKNRRKWFGFHTGLKGSLTNYIYSKLPGFVGIRNEHVAVPISKKTMHEVWEKEREVMHLTSTHKFRSAEDVSQYVFRYWNIASGEFEPIRIEKKGKAFQLRDENGKKLSDSICRAIHNHTYKMICINDDYEDFDAFVEAKNKINHAFESELPKKSSFEI